MNSNNLELSLLENEIDKISSKYQLTQQQQQSLLFQPPSKPPCQLNPIQSQPTLHHHNEGVLLMTAVKSPSVVTFGGTSTQSQQSQYQYQQQQNTLQELTLNKQGKVPQKDLKAGANLPKVNPKDLTNEELEYIIKTGKLPPRYNENTGNQMQNATPQRMMMPQSATNPPQKTEPFLVKTQPYSMQQQQQFQMHEKENSMFPSNEGSQQAMMMMQQPSMKNYNSPRNMADFLAQKTMAPSPFQMPLSQPVQLPTQNANSFQILDNSSYSKALDQSQMSNSQAASQALKALQDRVKQLENEKQLVEDKLSISEVQSQETIKKLQGKLKEEGERAGIREAQLKEELTILKKQVETVETEKLRHLEVNSSEREKWREQFKILEDENMQMKKSLSEYAERYAGIENSIQDIKRREALLRDRYEQELRSEKERNRQMENELDQCRQRYEDLKKKIKQKNQLLEQENKEMREELEQVRDQKDRECSKLNRECDKWKRESQMLKEELSIMGGGIPSKEKKKATGTQGINNLKESSKHSKQKESQERSCSRKRCCYSPAHKDTDCKAKTQQLITHSHSSSNFQSIDFNQHQQQHQVSSNLPSSRKKSRERTTVLSQSSSSAAKNRELQLMSSGRQRSEQRKQRQNQSCEKPTPEHKRIKHSASSKYKENRPQKSAKGHRKQNINQSGSKKRHNLSSSKSKPLSERSLNGAQSQQNLISINTKMGKAETVDDCRPSHQSSEYILIDNYHQHQQQQNTHQAQRTLTCLNESAILQQQQQQMNNKFNQYKRSSIETVTSGQFGLSQTSDLASAGLLYSHQSSLDNQNDFFKFKQGTTSNLGGAALDIGDLNPNNNEKQVVDNEIFYLEREIYDYNQQYKSLLSQQTNSNTSSNSSNGNCQVSMDTSNGANLNSKLRQIAQMLEEKSERLFDLKKQQQQIILKETYKEKNPFLESGRTPFQLV